MLRGEELAPGLTRIGRVVGDQELVGIAKKVDMARVKLSKLQFSHPFEHGGQTGVFISDGIAEAVAGRVEIGKKTLDVLF